MITIAVVGSLTKDRIIITKKNADYNQVGGGVYYTSHALASLGVHVMALPLLKKQDEILLNSLKHKHINIFPQWTRETTSYQNTYPAQTLNICKKKILSMVTGYSAQENLLKQINNVDAIHLVPLSSQEFDKVFFHTLRKHLGKALTISLDGQGFTQGPYVDVGQLLRDNIDIVKVDDAEARFLTRHEDEAKINKEFASWGIKEVLITKASQGSLVFFNEKKHVVAACPAKKTVDATGCGDAYMAGYLKKRLTGCDPVEAADFASLIGEKNIEFKGALNGDLSNL